MSRILMVLALALIASGCGHSVSTPATPPNAAPEPGGAIQYCREHPEDELCK